MGWSYTFQRFNNMKEFAQSIVDDVKAHQDKNKHEGQPYWEILAHQLSGNTLLIFAERINEQGAKEKDIFVYLLDKSEGEYGYKNMDAFCGPSQIVKLSKKWHDWFMHDNALLDDKKSTEWAKNWVGKCYQETLNGKTKSDFKKQLMKLLETQRKVPVRLTILDQRQVTLVGAVGRLARVLDTDGEYKTCQWSYLVLAE